MGRNVKRLTLESLLLPERRADITDGPYHVCMTPGCDTAYFGTSGDVRFSKTDLVVRFGLKETSPSRPVCYCFGHTVEGIEDEIRRTDRSTVVERIKAAMKDSGCRCEHTNPLGRCCLQSVEDVVTRALGAAKNEEYRSIVEPNASPHTGLDCCSGDTANAPEPRAVAPSLVGGVPHAEPRVPISSRRDRVGMAATGGAVLAATFSSACCWVPLLLVAFGVSAVGVAGFLEAYRPYFIAGAVVLLGMGFYTVHFRRAQCAGDSACCVPSHKLRVFNRIMLWTATALVGSFIFFPDYVGYLLATGTGESATADDARLVAVNFHVEGMTCEGCAAGLRAALAKLPHVASAEVDFATSTAVVRFSAEAAAGHEGVIEAGKTAGFVVTPADVHWGENRLVP